MKNIELSIIVYSCWKNRDMWKVFSQLFRKYWGNCEYPIILVTDIFCGKKEDYIFDQIVQKDATWACMIKEAIKQSNSPYVMLWMDDYLLCDYVKNSEIEKQLERMKRWNALNLRLIESPTCEEKFSQDSTLGLYKLGRAYSLSTQVGIWNAQQLSQIIRDDWSAWDFERRASLDKNLTNVPILVSLDYTFPYEEGVRKGKWMVAGVNLCKRNGISIDESVRKIMSNFDMAKIYIKGAFLEWNADLIVRGQNLLLRIFKK